MLKVGAVLLSLWSGLNLLVALGVTATTLAGRPPPALGFLFDDAAINQLDPRVLAVINAQALVANPLIVALCGLTLLVLWQGVMRGARWAWAALCFTLLPVQLFGFVSDTQLGGKNLAANVVSSLVLVAGLVLCAPRVRADTRGAG